MNERAWREEVNESAMSEALGAIHEEALKLARRDDLPEAVQDGLNLIILLSRHKADVRSRGDEGAAEDPALRRRGEECDQE